MAIEQPVFNIGFLTAAADYRTKQYHAVYVSADGVITVQTSAGGSVLGILQDNPDILGIANVMILGVSKVLAGGTLAAGDPIQVHTDGTIIKALTGDVSFGTVLIGCASGSYATVMLNAGTQNEID